MVPNEPGPSQPGPSQPGSSQPGSSQPGSSQPGSSEPGSSDAPGSDGAGPLGRAQRRRVLRTPPTPMRVDARRVIALGTAAWAVAAVVLACLWSWLGRHDHRVWLWTCVCGALLGVVGLALMGRHHDEGRF